MRKKNSTGVESLNGKKGKSWAFQGPEFQIMYGARERGGDYAREF